MSIEWREVPDFNDYLTGKSSTGKAMVKSKKRPKGSRMGIMSNGFTGGNVLKESDKGEVTLAQNKYTYHRVTPEAVYKSAFEGEPLVLRKYKQD